MKWIIWALMVALSGTAIAGSPTVKDDEHGYVPESGVVIDGRDVRVGSPEDCTNYLPAELEGAPAPEPSCLHGFSGPGGLMEQVSRSNPGIRPLWGDDILVDPGAVGPQPISADRGGNGDTVFVGVLKDGATADTLRVYRSTDQGQTWTMIRHAYGTDQTYSHLTLRYGRGAEDWVFAFWIITDASNNGDVWGRRISVDGSQAFFFHPTTLGDPDTITWVTATRDFNTNYGLNCFWQEGDPGDPNIRRARSTDYGDTWGELGLSQTGREYPHIDYAEDGYLYVCTRDIAQQDIRVGRSTNYGGSGSWSFAWITNDGTTYNDGICRVGATHDAGPTGMAWVMYNHHNGSDWDCGYGYTTDGGGTWNTDNVLAGGAGNQGAPDVESAGYGSNFSRAICLNDITGSYRVDYRSNPGVDPTSWGAPTTISDTTVYSGLMPKVTNYGSGSGNSALVAFPGQPTRTDLWVDTWHNLGVEEAPEEASCLLSLTVFPNPVRLAAEISYGLPTQGAVKLSVYDVSGQRVALIEDDVRSAGQHRVRWNAEDLPSGIYFISLQSNRSRAPVKKLVLLR